MTSRPPVFLDRDGTVIVEMHYLRDPDQVLLERGVLEGLSALTARRHPLIVLTNQSGISRGFFSTEDAHRVNHRVAELLSQGGIEVMGWYLCPHGPGEGCLCRKPGPGLALAAARDCSLELDGSFVVGDKRSDLELADAIGATGILLTTGHGAAAQEWARQQGRHVFEDMQGAAGFIIAAADAAAAGAGALALLGATKP